MDRFCRSCGSPVDALARFCKRCGARVAAQEAPAAETVPGSPVPPASPAPAQRHRSGGSGLKIVLIVLGVFAGITVIGIGSCIYVGYRLKQKFEETVRIDKAGEPGQSVTIRTTAGQIKLSDRTGQEAEKGIGGVPPYPGSKPVDAGAQLSFGAMGQIAGQEYTTEDPVDKVVAFYKEKLGEKLVVVENQGHFRLAVYHVEGQGGATTIDVQPEEAANRTKIFIAHVGK